MLFAVAYSHFYAKLFMNVFGQMLGAINASVLSSRTSEAEHKTGESALNVPLDVGVGKFVDTVQEEQNLTVVLKEADNGFVQACKLLVRFIASGVVRASAVKHISATISAFVLWYAVSIGEAEHLYHEGALSVIFTESGGAVGNVRVIGIVVCDLVSIGTLHFHGWFWLELRKVHHILEYIVQVGIGASVVVQKVAQVVQCGRNAVKEMLLAFEIATESVCAQYLEHTEEHTKLEVFSESSLVHLDVVLEIGQIDINQFVAQFLGVSCRGLPKEAGKVILYRSSPTSLKIDEMGISFSIEHYIACLEIAVHEGIGRDIGNVARHELERGFELQFMEIHTGSLQKAVFEVIQVEEHIGGIH